MNKKLILLGVVALSLAQFSAYSQFGAPKAPGGPSLSGAMSQLFGENPAFTATTELEAKDPSTSELVTMPAKLSYLEGKSRFEMDITKVKSARLSDNAAGQLKAMGMADLIVIARPDKKVSYMVYPGLSSYAEQAFPAQEAAAAEAKFKVEITEVGKETVDGHPCVKNKVVVTENADKKHEFTVFNATDLKKFPVRVEFNEGGQSGTMSFKDIKFAKPDASVFEPPKEFTRYESIQGMMQGAMMKMMGGGRPPK